MNRADIIKFIADEVDHDGVVLDPEYNYPSRMSMGLRRAVARHLGFTIESPGHHGIGSYRELRGNVDRLDDPKSSGDSCSHRLSTAELRALQDLVVNGSMRVEQ